MTENRSGNCWNCGQLLAALEYGRGDSCPQCGRDTRTCKGCLFYDKGTNNDCREPQADRVVDKEKANFCDYFKPTLKGGQAAVSRDTMKAAANALFKK